MFRTKHVLFAGVALLAFAAIVPEDASAQPVRRAVRAAVRTPVVSARVVAPPYYRPYRSYYAYRPYYAPSYYTYRPYYYQPYAYRTYYSGPRVYVARPYVPYYAPRPVIYVR